VESEDRILPPRPPDTDAPSKQKPSVLFAGGDWVLKVAEFTPVSAKSNKRRRGFSDRRRAGIFGARENEVDVIVRL
jgi:hypothetical protein